MRWNQFRTVLVFERLHVILIEVRCRTVNVARGPGLRWWLAAQNFHLPKDSFIISCNVSDVGVRRGRIVLKWRGWW